MALLGGASGTGKTAISYPLARRYGTPIVEVDDLVEAVLRMTTPDQQPQLHFWRTHPDTAFLPVAEIVRLQIAFAQALWPALDAVIGNHLETGTPVLMEGDYLLPALAVQDSFAGIPAAGRVKAAFLHEPEVDQLVGNYIGREPAAGEQRTRAEVSRAYGEWLAGQAAGYGLPVVAARPWETVQDRLADTLDGKPA